MKGLIIKEPWNDLILNGEKAWEIRGSNTNIRGTIALIKSGTGQILGTAVLNNCFQITTEAINQGYRNHRISKTVEIPYTKPHVWELSSPKKFKEPIPYKHPQGAVIWVNLSDEIFS